MWDQFDRVLESLRCELPTAHAQVAHIAALLPKVNGENSDHLVTGAIAGWLTDTNASSCKRKTPESVPDKVKKTEQPKLRRNLAGLGQIAAFRALEEVKWPRRIDTKFRPAIYGACASQCTTWMFEYFYAGSCDFQLSSIEPNQSISRLARIDPVWYGKFASDIEKRIPATGSIHFIWREAMESQDEQTSRRKLKGKAITEIPTVNKRVGKHFKLLRSQYVQEKLPFDTKLTWVLRDTSDWPLLNANTSAGKERPIIEECAKLSFLKKIRYPSNIGKLMLLDRKLSSVLEQLDPLVDAQHFSPQGKSVRDLLGRFRVKFWDWLSYPSGAAVHKSGLSHIPTSELKNIAHQAIALGDTRAIYSLHAAFDLRPVWQDNLEREIKAQRFGVVEELLRAGAKPTLQIRTWVQRKANPVMLALVGS